MNKIEKLIAELCPNGVEFKTLGEVSNITIGEFVHKNKQNPNGKYPVFNGGISNTGYYDEYNNTANKIIISARGANAGFVNKILVDYWAGNSCYTISINDYSTLDWNFVYYFLKQNQTKFIEEQQKGGIPAVSKKQVENFAIPIPPLPVQQEILNILDKFTALEAELETELEARKKQYEYFRNNLMLNDKWLMVSLGEIANVQSGGTPTKAKSAYWENGNIKWLGSTVCKNQKSVEEITDFITELGLKKSSAKILPKRTTLIAMVGATIGKVAFLNFEATTNQNVAALFPKNTNELNPDYLFYACQKLYDKFSSLANGKLAIANLSFIKSLEIPVPPLEEQNRIVAILDKFETLVNDISAGLPAEIKMRRQQYEYYRNKLLTFEKYE